MLFGGFYLGPYIPGVEHHSEKVIIAVIIVSLLPGLISWRRERARAAAAARPAPDA
jgi:membrane-associated protein